MVYNLYNGIVLDVYEKYPNNNLENETNERKKDNQSTIQVLKTIADNVINNEYFGEMLTECIRTEMDYLKE